MLPPLLRGQRIELRYPKFSDTEKIFSAIDDSRPELSKWLPWIPHILNSADIRTFISRARKDGKSLNRLEYCIFDATSKNYLGQVGTYPINYATRQTYIGYWIASSCAGNGYATEASAVLLFYLFDVIQLHKVGLNASTQNHASIAIARKLGFREDGILRENEYINNRWHDHLTFSLLKDEFESMRKRFESFLPVSRRTLIDTPKAD